MGNGKWEMVIHALRYCCSQWLGIASGESQNGGGRGPESLQQETKEDKGEYLKLGIATPWRVISTESAW
jgi:hypothetical protein